MNDDILVQIFKITRESKHCEGKKEKVYGYDRTGYWNFRCECGHISEWEKI